MRFQKMSWTLITLFLQCELYGASDADYIGPLRNVELIKQAPLCSRSPDDQAGPLYVVKSIEGRVWWLESHNRPDTSTCSLDDCITSGLIRGTLKSNITYKKQNEEEAWIPNDLKKRLHSKWIEETFRIVSCFIERGRWESRQFHRLWVQPVRVKTFHRAELVEEKGVVRLSHVFCVCVYVWQKEIVSSSEVWI